MASIGISDTTFGTKFNPEDNSNAEFLKSANMYDIRTLRNRYILYKLSYVMHKQTDARDR